jgi:hypothetical protein
MIIFSMVGKCQLLPELATSILRRVTALKMEAADFCESLVAACWPDYAHYITEKPNP